ncbi:hypothetical protein CLAFUW4_05853 [Fulvia fulva]|uniref:Uncharacterized protein n=1 Tax=Passalora fulva TaxID=5499 RepID=A0A9Q8P8Q2_PASFU|nr:uncharacterized protein CLAFUR5_05996 [Fulvia fulva]KAK4623661.1 hypothetical protein CLAFUR4_05847 [Fulvia fulva]KAK4624871.1 hypothetical protein CLAFUR0_05859 [Fulvia fulva]UJO17459.1 hypothetical protein CLAFUR5_05996 [Fulvia fulva]WPV14797.1 hypothetical protein CLAFUW4_05853 [Fulvia fulva]WPV29770.1 hypothetical protein CLAFUW7_05851 [Fulvia fulva]
MTTDSKVALARLLTRADEFLTFLDEHWYAKLPRREDDTIIYSNRSYAIMRTFDNERKKLTHGRMGKTKRVKVLTPDDVIAMIDGFKGVLHCAFFNATILVSRDLNLSYEVKVRRALESGQQSA